MRGSKHKRDGQRHTDHSKSKQRRMRAWTVRAVHALTPPSFFFTLFTLLFTFLCFLFFSFVFFFSFLSFFIFNLASPLWPCAGPNPYSPSPSPSLPLPSLPPFLPPTF